MIVNYNGGDLIRQCLRGITAQLEPRWDLIVVDNGSPDRSGQGLKAEFPHLKLVLNNRNLGFARAVNQALALSTAEYVLLLNPDAVPEPGALRRALDFMAAEPDVAILGARILRPNGRLDPPARRAFKTPSTYFYKFSGLAFLFPSSRRFGGYYLSYLPEDQITDVDSVVGAFMLVRRSVIDRIGPMDERFFMYCEDEDWCWRAKQAGGRVVYHPGVVVHHRKGESTALQPVRMAYHLHRSLVLYHRKNIARGYPAPVNAAVYAGIALGLPFEVGKRVLGKLSTRS